MDKDMELVCFIFQMVQNLWDIFRVIKPMEKDNLSTKTKKLLLEIGNMIIL